MVDLSMLQEFIAETAEHLEEMEAGLLQLESDPGNREVLDDIFRGAHTIKGSAEYLGMEKIGELSHKLENLLEILRHGDHSLNEEIIDTLMVSKDRIAMLNADLERSDTEETAIGDIIERIDRITEESGEKEETQKLRSSETQKTQDTENVQAHYENLKVVLHEIMHGEVDTNKKKRFLDILERYINVLEHPVDNNLAKQLENLKKQAVTLTFPDDACNMLDDLEKLTCSSQKPYISDMIPKMESISNILQTGDDTEIMPTDTQQKALQTEANDDYGDDDDDDETYEEEYDDELFNIFIDHLKENLALLSGQIKELQHSGNRHESLEKCLEYVDGLHSSANYMEYSKLTAHYEKWSDEIQDAINSLSSGQEIPFASFISRMEDYIGKTEKRFSQHIKKDENLLSAEAPEIQAQEYEELPSLLLDEAEMPSLLPDEEMPSLTLDEAEEPSIVLDEAEEPSVVLDETEEPLVVFDEAEEPSVILDEAEEPPAAKEEELPSVEAPDGFWEDELLSGAEASEDREAEGPTEYQGLFDELDDAFDIRKSKDDQIVDAVIKPAKPVTTAPKPFIEPEKPAPVAPEPKPVIGPEPVAPKNPIGVETATKHSLRVDARKIDSLMNQVGELVVSRAWFSQLYTEMRALQQHLQETGHLNQREMKPVRSLTFKLSEATVALGRVANELQEGVMKVRMLPISQLFNRYPRLVRDLVINTGKKVKLEIVGEETELDKMVIEEISDPLIHIIRNAVDHGCEAVRERQASGKPDQCILKLESYHESNHVVIEILDDGRGIDTDIVKAAALEKNLFSQEELERMTTRDLVSIIMKPGFSTASEVTKTSGRGVGMDVVKKNIDKLNGTIEIDSKKGVGTRFRIKIPLTLAIIRALLVKVGSETFTIPLTAVEETLRIFDNEITEIEGVEVIHLRDSTLYLLRLTELFGISSNLQNGNKTSYVVVVNTGTRKAGLVVDELICQEDAVIKPLEDYLQDSSGFSGATILGDGRISLILDVYELVNLSIGRQIKKKELRN